MTQIEAVFFDCDGTLVDSEVICSRAYVTMFRNLAFTLTRRDFTRFKGVNSTKSSTSSVKNRA